MSAIRIAPYFPFRKIRIDNQTVTTDATGAQHSSATQEALLTHISGRKLANSRDPQMDLAQDSSKNYQLSNVLLYQFDREIVWNKNR